MNIFFIGTFIQLESVVDACCRRQEEEGRTKPSEDTVLVCPTRTGSPTAVGSPPRLNKRDAVVTAVDPLSAIAHSSASRRPWASARRRDDGDGDGRLDRDGDARRRDGGDGDGRLDRDGDGCRPPPASTSAMLSSPDAVVAAVDADASTSTSREDWVTW
jgi:hypothetical protein